MSIEKAVWRLTGEIADWLDVDAGHLTVGARADVAVIDPEGLTSALEDHVEAVMPEFGDYTQERQALFKHLTLEKALRRVEAREPKP